MVRKTRSLGALVLCSICSTVLVNSIYDMVVDTQFHKFYGRLFARVLYLFLMKDIGAPVLGFFSVSLSDHRILNNKVEKRQL